MLQVERNKRALWLAFFAIAMALLEAIVVIYLRRLHNPENILQIFPIRFYTDLDFAVEVFREGATVLMLFAISLIATHKPPIKVFGCFVYLFGLWDIFFYAWLKIIIGWPSGWLDWDILFLIPWAWFGPWLCPVLVALLFAIWGGYVLLTPREMKLRPLPVIMFIISSLIGLASFLLPSLTVIVTKGIQGLRDYNPTEFPWWAFILGYIGMALSMAWSLLPKGYLFNLIKKPESKKD
ncbi:MAG: hypothetical protein JXR70_08895 [Spirochaetales bacterium]|nr:hypothetical protein [Spirochaetales bacterium]